MLKGNPEMKYKLKTIDVWDTLLRRQCHPDTIKYATSKYFYLKYYKLHGIVDLDTLFKKRVDIEREIGKEEVLNGYDDEYLFEDVIHKWCRSFLNTLNKDEIKKVSEDLCNYEFQLESTLTYPDETIVELIKNNPSDQTLFLSDFYMSKTLLQKLINKNGLGDFVTDGFSSADIRFNKRSGRLFDYVKDKLNVDGSQWLHIGDNEWSDVFQPGKRGINCIHYLPEPAHNNRLSHEINFHDKSKLFESIINKINNLYAKSVDIGNDNFKLGVKVSPFILGYTLYIVEKAIENDCNKIYFFTREGEFFIKAFRLVITAIKEYFPGVNFPEFDILEVSRLATFAASINEVTTSEMMRIWNLYSTQSMAAFFKTLNIEQSQLSFLLNRYGIDLDEVLRYPWQDSRIQALFLDQEFINIILLHRDTKRKELLLYFNGKGLSNEKQNVCVVDVGWRGTIQDNIALCLPNVSFHGVYLGLAKFLNPQPVNCKKYAYGPDLNISFELPHYLDSVAPIEMITNSPSGSVIGYKEECGNMIAIRKIDDGENKAWLSFTKDFQSGILFAIEQWKKDSSLYLLTSSDLRPLSMKIWGDLITGVNDRLNNAFSNLNHNETFGLGGYVAKNITPSLSNIVKACFKWNKRRELIDFVIANQWSDGVRRKKDLSFFHRHILALIIDLAVLYKRKFKRR